MLPFHASWIGMRITSMKPLGQTIGLKSWNGIPRKLFARPRGKSRVAEFLFRFMKDFAGGARVLE